MTYMESVENQTDHFADIGEMISLVLNAFVHENVVSVCL